LLQLARDTALRVKLGENGRLFVSKHFDVRQMVEALYGLYLQLRV
jgi:hypothetical protein